MHMSGKQPVGLRATQFFIADTPIRPIAEFEAFTYLGRPVGFNPLSEKSTVEDAVELGQKILGSALAPWQRLDALKTFLYPGLNFAMRMGSHTKSEWKRLDESLRPLIRRTLYLPNSAATDYIYGSTHKGACGIPIAAELSDAARVDTAFKLLTSRDPATRSLAGKAVETTVSKRLRTMEPVTPDLLGRYLSGDNENDFRSPSSGLKTVWTEARKASSRLDVMWTFSADGPELQRNEATIPPRRRTKVISTLRHQLQEERDRRLTSLANQGKVLECVALDKSSSHFMRSGQFTRFADWRFIHRARLNLLPLNGARPWTQGDKRCRRCGTQPETLPHVANHCMRYSAAYTKRHNSIVERVKRASQNKYNVISENQVVGNTGLRPDLVVSRGEEAIVYDVTIVFDNRPEALQAARRNKEEKYLPVKESLQRRYHRVHIEAVVIGSLGSWDPANDRGLKRLCSREYLKLMKKLCVSEVISSTRDIYSTHITGV
ncbi:uncharacterized protein LOC135372756 [Ornithodoros turicata]|uniref:uncharacterized protein LOC135372756 n=1 Tax=Ornithodoros turicata TaxID=34597 RepID=UPI00313A0F62